MQLKDFDTRIRTLADKLGVCYIPSEDLDPSVSPPLGVFWYPEDFVSVNWSCKIDPNIVMLHEIIHWTGTPNRCARRLYCEKGAHLSVVAVHFEEAVAEIGMYKLALLFGYDDTVLRPLVDRYLGNNCYLADLLEAGKQADKAVNWILQQVSIEETLVAA